MDEDSEESLRDIFEAFKPLEEEITKREDFTKRLVSGIETFSDSLDELINISGNLNDKMFLEIVFSSLISKLSELNFKYAPYPNAVITQVTRGMLAYLDEEMSKIDRTVLKKE